MSPATFLPVDVMQMAMMPIEGHAHRGERFKCPLITEIDHHLWQGGSPGYVGKVPKFFSYVVNLHPAKPYEVPEGISVLTVNGFDDTLDEPNLESLTELANWINAARALNENVLVHCQVGINRSALVVAFTLMQSGMTADEAITLIRAKRSPVCLNNHVYEGWLRKQ